MFYYKSPLSYEFIAQMGPVNKINFSLNFDHSNFRGEKRDQEVQVNLTLITYRSCQFHEVEKL